MATLTSTEKSYKTLALVLGIGLVIAVIGWISAANSTDAASLADRLESCDGLALASDDPECEDAIGELEGILVNFQDTLQGINVPPSATSTASTTSATVRLNGSTGTSTGTSTVRSIPVRVQ